VVRAEKMPVVELETVSNFYTEKTAIINSPVMAGTIYDSHLPLAKWFLATLCL